MYFNGKQIENGNKKKEKILNVCISQKFCSRFSLSCPLSHIPTQSLDRKSILCEYSHLFVTLLHSDHSIYMRYNPHFTPLDPSLICPCRVSHTPSQRSSCFEFFFVFIVDVVSFTYFPFIFAIRCKIMPTQEFKDHGVVPSYLPTPPLLLLLLLLLHSRKKTFFLCSSLPIFP